MANTTLTAINKLTLKILLTLLTATLFSVSSRGKIQAKNKGKIDMYFVEQT
jgi:hypothetical protein